MSQTLYVGHWDIKVRAMQAATKSQTTSRVNRKPENRSQALSAQRTEALKEDSAQSGNWGRQNASAERYGVHPMKRLTFNSQRNFKFRFLLN